MGAADSKLAFKKCVFRLFEERNIPSCDNDYWEQFWTLPECADDVFLLVGAQDIRRVRDNAQENLKCLIGKVLARLFWLCNSRDFLKEDAPAIQVLNCIRILARLFPFIFESEDMADWEEHYFWRSADTAMSDTHQMYSHHLSSSSVSVSTAQNEIQSRSLSPYKDQSEPNLPGRSQGAPKQEERTGPTYGQLLIKSLVDLLFTSGFTLPTALETRTRVSYVIWETGIGASNPIGTSKELDDNRTEVLRLLLILFSKSMYLSPANIATTENHWINTVATGLDRQRTIAVLCSLINSALKYNPSGWGLPYNHVMFSDERELLAMLCLQTIVALLDYRVIEKPLGDPCNIVDAQMSEQQRKTIDVSSPSSQFSFTTESSVKSVEHAIKNQFCHYLSRLHREQDFLFLTDGMYRILSNPMVASSTYLPGSTKQAKCHHETLMLCWKALEINKRFRDYLYQTNRVLDIVIILLYFSLENKQEASQIGLLQMCAHMLQTLSKDKTFGNCLNKAFDRHASLPANVRIRRFHGTYGDYLICSVYSLITTTKHSLRSLYSALISTIANVSPYLRNLSLLSTSRLLQLTTSFASSSYLLAEEANHEFLGIFLDAICSILYYQAPYNPHLIYTLVQYEPKIQTMAGFTLQRGLRDINKFRSRKPDKASSASSACDTSEPRISLGHDNENAIPQQDSGQSNRQEGLFSPPHRSSISNTPERKESNGVHTPSFNPNFCSDHGILKTTSALFAHPKGTPLSTDIIVHEENVDSTPTVALPDGDGGQEEDVEAENECLTISMDKSDRVIPSIPDDNTQDRSSEERLDSNSSIRDRCSGDFERREFDNSRTGGSFSSTRSTTSTTATLSIIDPSHQQGQATTTTVTNNTSLKDFVPSEEWVEAWMKTLRFEPLLMMLHHIVPEIESIQALNDHQVFDHIRSHVIPMLHQCLPEAGRPPIVVHKLAWDKLARWFQTLLWSQVFLGGGGRLGRQGLGAWYDTKVKLFSIQTAAAPVAATRAADNITSKPIVTANADTSSGSSSEAASTIHANEPVILSNAASSSRRAESKT